MPYQTLMLETRLKFYEYGKLFIVYVKLAISDNFKKLFISINEVLIYSKQGQNGNFLMHIHELMHIYAGLTFMVDICKYAGKSIIKYIPKE